VCVSCTCPAPASTRSRHVAATGSHAAAARTCVARYADVAAVSEQALVSRLRCRAANEPLGVRTPTHVRRSSAAVGVARALRGLVQVLHCCQLTVLGPWCTLLPFISLNGTLSTASGILSRFPLVWVLGVQKWRLRAQLLYRRNGCTKRTTTVGAAAPLIPKRSKSPHSLGATAAVTLFGLLCPRFTLQHSCLA
jgi:hypothetical protein